ncbi:STAS domain-containing protein [Streptomyces sp. NPDC057302]|uniref:STAS domain-containing protein n=1 Tax=Streptomyces sp. NPDC057302 TaxID=3346094 RepID=UPI003624F6C4
MRQIAHHRGDAVVLAVSGELDVHTAELLSDAVTAAMDSGHRIVILDCGRLVLCDSHGLDHLLALRTRLLELQGDLILTSVRPAVRYLLEVTGTAQIFTRDPGRDEALHRLSQADTARLTLHPE